MTVKYDKQKWSNVTTKKSIDGFTKNVGLTKKTEIELEEIEEDD